ncbi:MAG: glycosyltransferase [Mycobacterium sp.]
MTHRPGPTVAVAICVDTEDRWNEMVRAVTSVRQQTYGAAEIILVIQDNPALLRRASFELPGVVAIPDTGGTGRRARWYTAAAAATSDIVAILDDDAFAMPHWLEALVAPYSDPEVLAVGGRVMPQWCTGRPAWFPPEFDWVVGCSYRGMPVVRTPVRSYLGTSVSFRREVLLQCDRSDVRLGQDGSRLLFEPAAVVQRAVPRSRATWPYFRSRCYSAGESAARILRPGDLRQGSSIVPPHLRSAIRAGITSSITGAIQGDRASARAGLALSAGVVMAGVGFVAGSLRLAAGRHLGVHRPSPPYRPGENSHHGRGPRGDASAWTRTPLNTA